MLNEKEAIPTIILNKEKVESDKWSTGKAA
jgi:hypothetical protein